MLAKLFSKTKPINYVILTFALVTIFILQQIKVQNWSISGYELLKIGSLLVILILSAFTTQFIVQKNRLVKDNAFVPFFYITFILFFPDTLLNAKVIIANFFVLLALRRLFALHSLKSPQEKLFDASLFILIASLFYFWAIFFLALLFFAVTSYVKKDYRNWIIPLIAFFVVFVFLSVYLIIEQETYVDWTKNRAKMGFDFTIFSSIYQNIALAIFSSIAILFFVAESLSLKNKPFNMQSSYKKILIAFLVGVAIYIVSKNKNNGVLLFTFFPLAVLASNYIEALPQEWRKEVFSYGLLSIGLFLYFAQLFS